MARMGGKRKALHSCLVGKLKVRGNIEDTGLGKRILLKRV